MAPRKARTRNFHAPLTESTYVKLRKESKGSGRPATEIARVAIESWLRARERMEVAREISEYATAMAGTPDDLDEDLEIAGVQALGMLEQDR